MRGGVGRCIGVLYGIILAVNGSCCPCELLSIA